MSKHAKPWTESLRKRDNGCRYCGAGSITHTIPRHRKTGPAK